MFKVLLFIVYLIQPFLYHAFQYVIISGFVMFLIMTFMKTPWDSFEVAYVQKWSLNSWICFAPCPAKLLEPVQILQRTKATELLHATFGYLCCIIYPGLLFGLPLGFTPVSKESNPTETNRKKIEIESSPPKFSKLIEAKIEIESSPPKYSETFEAKTEVENSPPKYSELFDATIKE